jgi:hypothetical protein
MEGSEVLRHVEPAYCNASFGSLQVQVFRTYLAVDMRQTAVRNGLGGFVGGHCIFTLAVSVTYRQVTK